MSQSQIELELPDGSTLTVPADATPLDVAREIGRGLAKAACRMDGTLEDSLGDRLLGLSWNLIVAGRRPPATAGS